MVSRRAVTAAYRSFLRREPESAETINRLRPFRSITEVCRILAESDEYKSRFARVQTPLDWPPIKVSSEVEESLLVEMILHVQRTWTTLGDTEPHWSVLSVPEYRRDNFDKNAEQFRASGMWDVELFRSFAARAGIDLVRYQSCFELGCGVGRVTRWLAGMFPSVIACDLSRPHLKILSEELTGLPIRPMLLENPMAVADLPEFDVFFSVIALQHNPPPVMAQYIRCSLNKLRPGGIAYFQIPTYRKNYAFDPHSYLKKLPNSGEMEMHVVPQSDVFTIITECSCRLLEVREDGYTADSEGISNTFFVTKV